MTALAIHGHVAIMIDAVMMFRALVITIARCLHPAMLVSVGVGRLGDTVLIVSQLRQISIGATIITNSNMYLDNREAGVPIKAELGLMSGITPPPNHGQVAVVTRHVESVEGESTLIPNCAQP